MKTGACVTCGYKGKARAIVAHHIIPEEIAEQAEISGPGAVSMCANCLAEVAAWYPRKVSSLVFDTGTRRFRPRTPAEMVTEYEAAYSAFVEYKKREQKKHK